MGPAMTATASSGPAPFRILAGGRAPVPCCPLRRHQAHGLAGGGSGQGPWQGGRQTEGGMIEVLALAAYCRRADDGAASERLRDTVELPSRLRLVSPGTKAAAHVGAVPFAGRCGGRLRPSAGAGMTSHAAT